MSNYATMLFNKVIEQDDINSLKRTGLTSDHFTNETDKNTYNFIVDFAEKNDKHAPSLEVVMTEIDNFIAVPGVEESYEFLTRQVMNEAAAVQFRDRYEAIATEFADGQRDMDAFISTLTDDLRRIKMETSVRTKTGTSVKLDADFMVREYEKREAGETAKEWESLFPVIKRYVAGNMYVVYGKSGRGKSVITLRDAVHMAEQGATVLIWSMEMPTYQVMARLYSFLSADAEMFDKNIDGALLKAGFNADEIRRGTMDSATKAQFVSFVSDIINALKGDIIIRGVDDSDFHKRDLNALEADLINTGADVLVIDPFYYLDYEKNTSKTTGGDAANTSKRLRRLTGTHSVVTLAITQADESDQHDDGEGTREISLPKRSEVSKTKALLQDASQLIAIDTDYLQNRGLVGLNKGRDGGEGTSDEIVYIPQFGVVQPMANMTSASDFNSDLPF